MQLSKEVEVSFVYTARSARISEMGDGHVMWEDHAA
jgi:hypothetical protein